MTSQDPSTEDANDKWLAASGYLPSMTPADDGRTFTLRLVRRLRVDGRDERTIEVWSRTFDDAEAARLLEAWLVSEAPRLTEYGRLASILGPGSLDRLMEARLAAAAAEQAKRAAAKAEKARPHHLTGARRGRGVQPTRARPPGRAVTRPSRSCWSRRGSAISCLSCVAVTPARTRAIRSTHGTDQHRGRRWQAWTPLLRASM